MKDATCGVRRWHLLLMGTLFFGSAMLLYWGLVQQEKAAEELEQQKDWLLHEVGQQKEQIRIANERLERLESALADVQRLEAAFKGTGLEGIGPALVAAEREFGVDALLLAGICAHESSWGQSRLARERNNLAGLGAYDDCPGRALRFDSRGECVWYLARLIERRGGGGDDGGDGGGSGVEEIGVWYASDPGWAAKVGACMEMIKYAR